MNRLTPDDPELVPIRLFGCGMESWLGASHDRSCSGWMNKEEILRIGVTGCQHKAFDSLDAFHNCHARGIGRPWSDRLSRPPLKEFLTWADPSSRHQPAPASGVDDVVAGMTCWTKLEDRMKGRRCREEGVAMASTADAVMGTVFRACDQY